MATPAPVERTRIYKEFLTPALHRRFISAASILLGFCWFEACLLSQDWHPFWTWFPFGATGPRSLLLFGPCLAVFIVRVANIHIGARASTSPAATVYEQLGTPRGIGSTLNTVGWYLWSGWFFGEVFVWSRSPSDSLAWIDPGQTYERPRLNENAIVFRAVFVILSLTQAVTHLARDYDRITLPADQVVSLEEQVGTAGTIAAQPGSPESKLSQPLNELPAQAGTVARRAVNLTLCAVVLQSIPLYYGLLRSTIWQWTYAIARTFSSQLPPSAPPSGLLNASTLIFQILVASLMLGLLWELSNAVFDVYVAQSPLRKGQPLTSEVKDARGVLIQRSKDPNGSLITGLKSKKDVPKGFAFWELYLICTQFDGRRRTIYTEVDRKDGPTWSQVYKHSIAEVEAIKSRIALANAPAQAHGKQEQPRTSQSTNEAPLGLPRIADQLVKDNGNVFAKRKPDFIQSVGDAARSLGQSPGGHHPLSPHARKAIEWGTDRILTKDQQLFLSRQNLEKEAGGWTSDLLKSPLGEPFRQTFARRVTAVVFGAPHSSRANIVHAASALAKLAVCSLKEDDYGQVSKDIPKIVRVFTETIQATEAFVAQLQPSRTDVLFTARDRNVKEVQDTLDVLKRGLEDIILAFGEYAAVLGLSKKEVREAKEASARKTAPDMAEVFR